MNTIIILTSTKTVIRQLDGNYFPFQSLNILPFHIRPKRLKLIYYSLILSFPDVTLKVTQFNSFHSSYLFSTLELESNCFSMLLLKIAKLLEHNGIRPPVRKIFQNYKPIRYYLLK